MEVCEITIVDPVKVESTSASLPEAKDIRQLSELFKILGDSTRLRIVLALSANELCVCDLAAVTGMSISAISHQLRLLRDKNIVSNDKRGKMVYYKLDDHHIENLIKESLVHIRE